MHLILVSMWFFTKKVNVFTKKNLQLRRRPVWALGHLRCKPFVGHWPWYQRCWSVWSLKVWCFFCCVFFSVSSCCLFLVDGAGKGEVVVFMLILFAFLEKFDVCCLLVLCRFYCGDESHQYQSWAGTEKGRIHPTFCVLFFFRRVEKGRGFVLDQMKNHPINGGINDFCWSGFNGDISMVRFFGKKRWIIWSWGEIHQKVSNLIQDVSWVKKIPICLHEN